MKVIQGNKKTVSAKSQQRAQQNHCDQPSYKPGDMAEEQAAAFLLKQGMRPVARNFHCRFGEIDIITADNDTLIFTEVRLRKNSTWGSGAETVDRRKQRKILITAQYFLQCHKGYQHYNCRFDVISAQHKADRSGNNTVQFDLTWIPNAFDASILAY